MKSQSEFQKKRNHKWKRNGELGCARCKSGRYECIRCGEREGACTTCKPDGYTFQSKCTKSDNQVRVERILDAQGDL